MRSQLNICNETLKVIWSILLDIFDTFISLFNTKFRNIKMFQHCLLIKNRFNYKLRFWFSCFSQKIATKKLPYFMNFLHLKDVWPEREYEEFNVTGCTRKWWYQKLSISHDVFLRFSQYLISNVWLNSEWNF